mgnify:CR=1 FL=1
MTARRTHLVKAGTPTMGGALILVSITDHRCILWARSDEPLRRGS